MTTQTQSILDVYKSVLSKFNLIGWEGGDSNILHISHTSNENNLIGKINLKTWEVTRYEKVFLTPDTIAEFKKELSAVFIKLLQSVS